MLIFTRQRSHNLKDDTTYGGNLYSLHKLLRCFTSFVSFLLNYKSSPYITHHRIKSQNTYIILNTLRSTWAPPDKTTESRSDSMCIQWELVRRNEWIFRRYND